MITAINILLLVVLGILACQDFRMRKISVLGILVLCFLAVWKRVTVISWEILCHDSFTNGLFVLIQLLMLSLYFLFRKQTLKSLFSKGIGPGDLLFFAILCIAFPSAQFMLLFLSSLVFSLIAYGIYMLLNKNANKQTPLAGLLALFWMAQIILSGYFHLPV
jgi:hypothetical protein